MNYNFPFDILKNDESFEINKLLFLLYLNQKHLYDYLIEKFENTLKIEEMQLRINHHFC